MTWEHIHYRPHTHTTHFSNTHTHTHTHIHTHARTHTQTQLLECCHNARWSGCCWVGRTLGSSAFSFGYYSSYCSVACEPPQTQKFYGYMGRSPATSSALSFSSPFVPPPSPPFLSPLCHSLVRMTVWYQDWSVYQSKGIQWLFHVHTKMLTTREEHSYRNLSPQSQVVRGVTLIQVVAVVILSCLFCCHVASTGRCPCSPPPYFLWRGSGGGRLVMIEPYPNLFCSNLQVFNFGPCRLMSVLCASSSFTWQVILSVNNDTATNTVFVIPNLNFM